MAPTPAFFLSSGDLIADRRYQHARELGARGDWRDAADVLVQAVERAPAFASAWFTLAEIRERLGDPAGAIAAFMQAQAADPADRHGAGLRLARLGAAAAGAAMSPGYLQALFDQYAPQFDDALLRRLDYRGPQLLRAAIEAVCLRQGRMLRFSRALDLGCGTGVMGEALKDICRSLCGIDLSPGMIAQARRKGIYGRLEVGEMLALLRQEADAGADLALAADALVYVADLAPVCGEVARVLQPGGLFAFTVETHPGDGVVLGEKLRYAHGEQHVRHAVAAAGLDLAELRPASTRTENQAPVPGLVGVAARMA